MSFHNLSSKISLRIYYEDTDAGGIVYHSKYLNFAERARAEFLRNLSLEQTYIKDKYQVQFVVKNLKVSYIYSCKLDDQINLVTDLESINRAKLCFRHIFYKEKKTDILIIEPLKEDIKEKPDEIELFPHSDSSIWDA